MLKKMATPWASAVRNSPTAQPASTSSTGSTLRRRKLTAPKTTAKRRRRPTNEHPHHPGEAHARQKRQAQRQREGGPGVDAEKPRVGQGVAGDALHDGAGHGESRTHQNAACGAGAAQLQDATCSWFAKSGEKSAPSTWSGGMGVLPKNSESPAASATAITPTARKTDVPRRDTNGPR